MFKFSVDKKGVGKIAQFIYYIEKVLSGSKPFWGFLLAGINYVLFPEKAYLTAAVAVGGAILLDILSKYIVLSGKFGGYKKAVKEKKIRSKILWQGTGIKLVSYLVIFILAGLGYRLSLLKSSSFFLGTVVYTVVFLREAQSIVENLCEAGADLKWLLIWTKKKQKEILEPEEAAEESQGGETDGSNHIDKSV